MAIDRENRQTGRRRWMLLALLTVLIGWSVFILTRSMKTAVESSSESRRLLRLLKTVFPTLTDHTVRKLAHFSEYCLLGLLAALLYALWRRPSILWPLLGCLLLAAADETVQLFFPGRSGELRDVALDTLGAACAIVPLYLLLKRSRRSQ